MAKQKQMAKEVFFADGNRSLPEAENPLPDYLGIDISLDIAKFDMVDPV
jgi:hypothetical protein